MSIMVKLILFGLRDLVRSKWSLLYALFFTVATEGLLRMVVQPSKVLLSLMSLALYLVPLVSMIFGIMYFYNSREFFKLLLAQPVRRSTVYSASFFSVTLSLSAAYLAGIAIPFALRGLFIGQNIVPLLTLLAVGLCLTASFVGLAFLIAISIADRGKGVGLAVFVWLAFAVLYDGATLFAAHILSAYPLEKILIGISLTNPIDLGRILMLMEMDFSALMGYTGAVFERFFGTSTGIIISGCSLLLWTVLPAALGRAQFSRRDL